MSTRIELIDTRTASEETLRALHELYLDRDAELEPVGDPVMPFEQRLIDWQHLLETEEIPRFALWEGSEIIATSGAHLELEQNLENAIGWVYVRPGHRGNNLGRAISTPMFDLVQSAGRTRFAFEMNQGRPEEKICELAGMKAAYTAMRSRLSFPDLDWSMLEMWVKRAEERASDYELLLIPSGPSLN